MKPIHYLVAFAALNHGTLAAARVAVALYAVYLEASPTVVGILVALFSVIPTLACVPMGRLVDRTGARKPMLACTLLSSGGAVLPFFWEAVPALVITGFVVGGAYFALYIVNTTLGGRYGTPEERTGNFAMMHLGIAAANGVGPLIAGFGIDYLGHAYTFLLIALLPLASLAIMLAGRLPKLDEITPPARDEPNASFVDLLRDRRLFPVYLTTVMFMLAWDIFMVMTPLYGKELGMSASQIGIVISTYSAAVFVVRMFLGPLTRRFTTWQLLLISLSIAASCMIGYGISGALPLLILFAFGMGFGQGMGGPLGNTAMYEVAPAHRVSEALGLRMSVTTACQTGLPLIAGGLSSLIGVAPLFWVAGATIFAGVWRWRWHWHGGHGGHGRSDAVDGSP
jgi:MFS family permease